MRSSENLAKWLALAALVAGGLVSAQARGADTEGLARKHAAKANKLAAKNKCKQALPWFNRAYRTLKDPTLLFNRAECLRKLGENLDAIRDYELFLTEMPAAPNRAVVEGRIAALNAVKAPGPGDGTTSAPEPAVAKAADKPAAPVEKAGAAKPADKAGEPVRRAEKWTD